MLWCTLYMTVLSTERINPVASAHCLAYHASSLMLDCSEEAQGIICHQLCTLNLLSFGASFMHLNPSCPLVSFSSRLEMMYVHNFTTEFQQNFSPVLPIPSSFPSLIFSNSLFYP